MNENDHKIMDRIQKICFPLNYFQRSRSVRDLYLLTMFTAMFVRVGQPDLLAVAEAQIQSQSESLAKFPSVTLYVQDAGAIRW